MKNLFDSLPVIDKIKEKVTSSVGDMAGQISFDKLFSEDFMKKFTDFSSFKDFLAKGNFNIKSMDDIKNILGDKFNTYIKGCTKFVNWEEMYSAATKFLTQKKE